MSGTGAPIEIYNRYTQRIETELVYGERWLRWTYETVPGRLWLPLIARRAWFSRWYGWRMSRPASVALIEPFISRYAIDTDEFEQPPSSFGSFNAFFCRRLKPSARPIDPDPDAVVFPADGRHLGLANIAQTDGFYAKGQTFNLRELLADADLATRFSGGPIVISRLCPVDYHRFHFPCAGEADAGRLIDGVLYSVSPVSLRRKLACLWENKRRVTLLDQTRVGLVASIEIGATCVGSIVPTAAAGAVSKGTEKGYFQFGGSCVITLFESGRVRLDEDLLQHSSHGREIYARMGDRLGSSVR